MKKFSIYFMVLFVATSAFSHALWVTGKNDNTIKATMIYGHDFPIPEEIKEERRVLFEPVKVMGENTNITLSQKGKFYNYEGKERLKEGTYILQATYVPTPWTETADRKWHMNKTRKDIQKEVKQCAVYSMSAKSILNVGNADSEFITKPLGKGVEFTPLEKVSHFKEGVPIKFKVTKDGKPLKIQEVYGNLEAYSKNDMSMAFYGKTNLKGEVTFKALKSGLWYLKTSYKQNSGNKDCEYIEDEATISFEIK